ncbi:MurR/RpiR family transcriptional regulator, partial [Aeromonas caviae]|uniref:MurR/RpiR family transcriptional regulator n=1 Tax=Aeromonas caviae TaxID=648 RepID=UPI003F495C8E
MFNNQLVSTLNAFEFKVYNYVIKNHQTVIYMTVRELAEACDVSTATILRFCKKMNCSGYAEFKAYLKMNAEKRGEISLPHGANAVSYTNMTQPQTPRVSIYISREPKTNTTTTEKHTESPCPKTTHFIIYIR